jgi:L-ascorbate metabolism protein UlaG (beta-lactamase superfamily)
MLQVTYIHHSCFVVELDHTILVFDYFPAEAVEQVAYQGVMPTLDAAKEIFVFASHCHRDHFSLEVLRWAKKYPHICFVLSKDIRLGNHYLQRNGIDPTVKEQIRFVTPRNRYQVGDITVDTLRSTDAGVAFVVEAEGQRIYHAGDLHWWNAGMENELNAKVIGNAYKKEINCLKNRHIDVAFVVLDPRLGEGYALGMEYFLQHVEADVVFPMHLWKQYDLIQRLRHKPELLPYADKVVELDRENVIYRVEG